MKHGKKLIIATLIAMCLLGCTLLAACDDNNNTTPSDPYVITVLTDDGSPVSGVKLLPAKGGTLYTVKETGADGKVSFDLTDDTYTITVVNGSLPNGYTLPEGEITLSPDNRTAVITLVAKPAYKVTLVNEDGTPFYAEGVMVGVCTLDGNCLNPEMLGASGVVKLQAEPGNYKVNILNLPDGYAFDTDEEGYHDGHGYYGGEYFSADNTELTITVYRVSEIDTQKKMTVSEKQTFNQAFLVYEQSLFEIDAYETTDKIGGKECRYYSFTANITGNYALYAPDTNLGYTLLGSKFNHDPQNTSTAIYQELWYKFGVPLHFEAGKQNYIRVRNNDNDEKDIRFVLVAAVGSTTDVRGANPTATVTIAREDACALIEFTSIQAASYNVTAQGDELVSIVCVANRPSDLLKAYDADAEFVKNAEISHKILDAETTVYYLVSVKNADAYPVSFDVKITQISKITNVTDSIKAPDGLQKYEDRDAQLTALPMTEDTKLVYNETDGYYHLGSKTGEVVLINLTGAIESVDEEAFPYPLAYFDRNVTSSVSYVFDVTTEADRNDLTKGNTYADYTSFLRGFTKYNETQGVQGPIFNIPTNIKTESYFTKYVNSDGVYPLTEELKTFAELFWKANSSILIYNITDSNVEYGWMFPLCYYKA